VRALEDLHRLVLTLTVRDQRSVGVFELLHAAPGHRERERRRQLVNELRRVGPDI
jgi:hypothetical protein